MIDGEINYKALLDEAFDWLCPHTEALEQRRKHGRGRYWCCDCHNYIRTEEDATLFERVAFALGRTTHETTGQNDKGDQSDPA